MNFFLCISPPLSNKNRTLFYAEIIFLFNKFSYFPTADITSYPTCSPLMLVNFIWTIVGGCCWKSGTWDHVRVFTFVLVRIWQASISADAIFYCYTQNSCFPHHPYDARKIKGLIKCFVKRGRPGTEVVRINNFKRIAFSSLIFYSVIFYLIEIYFEHMIALVFPRD